MKYPRLFSFVLLVLTFACVARHASGVNHLSNTIQKTVVGAKNDLAHAALLTHRSAPSNGFLLNNAFHSSNTQSYSTKRGEYVAALTCCDSLIHLQKKGVSVSGRSYVENYKIKARLLQKMGRSEAACAIYEQVLNISDSLSKKHYLDTIGEMNAKLNVEALEVQMLTERKQNQLILMVLVLTFLFVVGAYFYSSLRRERHLKDELRRQCEVSQECGRMKAAFLNMMSHEVRTPLNVISGFAEVLASGSVSKLQQDEYLGLMQEHARMLTSLMDDMLEVANLDNCSDDLPCDVLCVNTILRNTIDYAQANRRGKEIVFRLDLPDEEVMVQTSAEYLTHVLHELVKNALKFTKQGSITLGCRVDRPAGTLDCFVTDTGVGVPADKTELIFDRFFQLDTFAQGIGLGLYLCRLIMQKLDGTIHVDSSYVNGLRVVVSLPLSKKKR